MKKTMLFGNYANCEIAIWDIELECRSITGWAADASIAIAPLAWYVNSGRASMDFCNRLVNTNKRQKSTIARRLCRKTTLQGTYDGAVSLVRSYLEKVVKI